MIPDIVKAISDNKEKKITRYPNNTIRASSIGYFVPEMGGCARRGTYEITNWQDKKLHNVFTQFIFDEGNYQERLVLRDMLDAGYELIETQSPFELKEHNISGTIDGKLPLASAGGRVTEKIPVEIKSMSPHIYDSIHTYEDFKKYPWTNVYRAQLNLYLHIEKSDVGLFILKNKSTGMIKAIEVKYDPIMTGWCFNTAGIIQQAIKSTILPDGTDDVHVCKKCPFVHICKPGVNFEEEIKVEDNPVFEEKLDRYFHLKPLERECKNLYDDEIRPSLVASAIEGSLNMKLGKYLLTGKTSSKGVFRADIERM